MEGYVVKRGAKLISLSIRELPIEGAIYPTGRLLVFCRRRERGEEGAGRDIGSDEDTREAGMQMTERRARIVRRMQANVLPVAPLGSSAILKADNCFGPRWWFRKNDPYNELDATRGAHPPLLFISGERCSRESRGRSTVLSVNSLSPESRGGAAVRANLVESTRLARSCQPRYGNGNWRGARIPQRSLASRRMPP